MCEKNIKSRHVALGIIAVGSQAQLEQERKAKNHYVNLKAMHMFLPWPHWRLTVNLRLCGRTGRWFSG